MQSRLEDLIATADRQLAGRSYDAAIDTFRTALLEPGAADAGVEQQLETACRARDEARGIVRTAPPPPAPAIIEAAAPAVEPIVEPEPAPPAEPVVANDRPADPPAFPLIERPERKYPLEVERISILNPEPLPEDPDPLIGSRILVAVAIFLVVCAVALILK